MEQISIYQRPGNFIFFVKNKGEVVFIGGTKDINAKSFKFDFEFDDIIGYYYPFPDFGDEIDRLICMHQPRENKSLRTFMTLKSASEKAKGIFKKYNISFPKKVFTEKLQQNECFAYRGLCYYSSLDCDITIEAVCNEFGIWNIL